MKKRLPLIFLLIFLPSRALALTADQVCGWTSTDADSIRVTDNQATAIEWCATYASPNWWDEDQNNVYDSSQWTIQCQRKSVSDTTRVVAYPTTNNCNCYFPCDTDGDGISDITDPFPEDTSDIQCTKIHWQQDGTQTVIWEKWKCINTNGGKTYVEFGTRNLDEEANHVYTTLGTSWVDGSELFTSSGSSSGSLDYAQSSEDSGTGSAADGGTTVATGTGTTATGTGTGTDYASGDTTEIVQQKTTTNTARTADNTKALADLQAETNKKLDDQNKILNDINENLKDQEEKTGSFSHDSTGDYTAQDYSQSEDLQIQTKLDELGALYANRFEEFIDNLKTSAFIGTQLAYFDNLPESTDSVIDVEIGRWGNAEQQSAAIDLSAFSSSFQTMRTILMVVCGFFCIRIILLKKG